MLCEYGCGQEAKFPPKKMRSTKWCCSDDPTKCMFVKEKNRESHKGRYKGIQVVFRPPKKVATREEINKKISNTLKGKPSKLKGRTNKWSNETHIKVSESHKIYQENKRQLIMKSLSFEQWPKALIRRYLFEEIGNKCQRCGFEYTDSETGKGPFEPHHKDGDKNNWKRENLEILCLNCHWMTPHWKFKNRKHKLESIQKGLKTKQLNLEGL